MDEDGERAERARRALETIHKQCPDVTIKQLREMLDDPERRDEATPILHVAAEALAPAAHEVGAAASELLALTGEVMEIAARVRAQVRATADMLGQAAASARRLPAITMEIFEPYRREIETAGEGGIPPPAPAERVELLLLALAMQLPEEADQGALPPLEQVALVAERYDIAAALLRARYPDLARRLQQVCADPQQDWSQARQEAVADVYLALGDTFLGRVWNATQELKPSEARRKLRGALSEAYVFAGLRNERIGWAKREGWLDKRTDREVQVEEDLSDTEMADSQLARMTLEGAIGTCLRESTNPDLDARIIEAMRAGMSMEALARETGVPASTLKYRRRKITERLSQRLLEEPEA